MSDSKQELFIKNTYNVLAGFELAEQIIDKDMTHHYFIMDGNIQSNIRMIRQIALFKSYYNGEKSFYEEEKYGNLFVIRWIIKTATVVIKKEFEALARLSDAVDEIIVLQDDELEQLNAYAKSIIHTHENIHRDEYGSGKDLYDEALKMKMFGVSSYRFEMRVPMQIPDEDMIMNRSMFVPAQSYKTAKEIFEKNCCYKDNAVVICNGIGKSKGIISDEIWQDVIKMLHMYGIQVCQYMNDKCGAENRECFNGVMLIKEELDILAGLLKLGVKIIGGCAEDVAIAEYMNYASQMVILSDNAEQNECELKRFLER